MKLYGHDLSELLQLKEIILSCVSFFGWLITRKRFANFWTKWSRWVITLSSGLFVYGIWRLGWLAWLGIPIPIPLWAAITCTVPVLLSVWMIIKMAADKIKTPSPSEYLTDEMFGIRWRWQYYHGVIEPGLIDAFCPRQECQCRLDVEQMSVTSYLGTYRFICPNCGFTKVLEGPEEKIRRSVAVEVERRIRTGEFQKRTS